LDPYGEELRVESAVAHARGVELRRRQSLVDVRAFVNDELHGVCVHVHGDGAAVYGERVVGSLAARARRGGWFVILQLTLLRVTAMEREQEEHSAHARGTRATAPHTFNG